MLLSFVAPGHAGPIRPADVPVEAQWVAHVDIRGLLESSLGKFMMSRGNLGKLEEGLAIVRQSAGFDPTTDLESITAFGPAHAPEAAVALVRGNLDPDALLALVQGPDDSDFEHGEHTIHQWTQATEGEGDDGRRYAAFLDDTLIVGRTRAAVEGAVDHMVTMSQMRSGRDAKPNPLLGQQPEGAFLWAAARDIQMPQGAGARGDPVSQQLRHIIGGMLALGDAGDVREGVASDTRLMIRVTAADAGTAGQMRQVLGGVSALGRFLQRSAKPGQTPDAWVPLAAAARVEGESEGEAVQLSIQMPTAEFVQRVQAMIQEQQAKRASPPATAAE